MMEFNAENMYLLALVETLKKENDSLKIEKIAVLQKLETVEKSVSRLEAKLLEKTEAKQDITVAIKKVNLKNQLEKIQNIADKLVKVSEQKYTNGKTSKTKCDKLTEALEDQDKRFNETSMEYPVISRDDAESMIDHIWHQPNSMQVVKSKSEKGLETTPFRPQYAIPAIKSNNALAASNEIQTRRIPLETMQRDPKRNNSNFSYEYLTELSKSIYPYHLVF